MTIVQTQEALHAYLSYELIFPQPNSRFLEDFSNERYTTTIVV